MSTDKTSNRTAQHTAAGVLLIALLVVWFYACIWVQVLLTHGSTYPLKPQDLAQFWQFFAPERSFLKTKVLTAFAMTVLFVAALFEIYKDRRTLHGDARWASMREIKNAGLLATSGIIIGKFAGKFLVLGSQLFVLLAAPTRAGKGVSMVIPNLLNWMGSLICMDTKLENWNTTSAYRKRVLKQEVYLFNPFASDRKTHRWNPLDEVRRDPVLMGGDVLQIAQIFYPERAGDKNPFFTQQAQNLFFGLTMFLLESKHPRCSLSEVFRQGSGYDKPLREHLLELLDTHPQLSRQCRDALHRFLSNPEETFGNIKASFDAPLLMFANPLVDMATSGSDFKLSDVRRKRMSVYFGITPNRLVQAERLINLFFTQVIALNTEVLPENDKSLKHECLLVNDEFTAFGRIAILIKAVSFMAGYGLRLLTIVQSKSQLQGDGLYSAPDARNLIVNHDVKVAFTPGDDQEAKEVSEMLGTYTKRSTSVSSNRSTSVLVVNSGGNSGESTSDQRRALMMAQELKYLSLDHEIIDKKGLRPILAEKIFYFKDPVFVDRLKMVSPSLAALGSALPTREQLDQARIDGELAAPVAQLLIDTATVSKASDDSTNAVEEATTASAGQAISDPYVKAAADYLARDLADWSAFSTGQEVKAHILKKFFMQDFMGDSRHVSI